MRVGFKGLVFAAITSMTFSFIGGVASHRSGSASVLAAARSGCPKDESGLKLSPGFCATIFADGIGHARHLVVSPNGVVYVNTWSGAYFPPNEPVHEGG